MSAVQRKLLLHLSEYVRLGGVLVYATCTIAAEENDDVLASFLSQRPAFAIDDARAYLPESAHVLVDEQGSLRTLPHRHGLDGFFAVRLKRNA